MRILLAAVSALLVVVTASAAPAAQADRARGVVERAAQAMGGRDRLMALRSLSYEGLGWNANLLQQMRPEAPLLLWSLPTYRRTIDLANGRMATEMVRRPAFPAVFDNARADNRIDGDVAWDVAAAPGGAAPAPRRAAASEAVPRRLDMLHHPLTAVRAALGPGARLRGLPRDGADERVEVTTARGERFTLAVDGRTGLPSGVSTLRDHVMLGDSVLTTRFSGYEYLQPQGVRLPKRLLSSIDRFPDYDIGIMSNALDVDTGMLAAPPAVRDAAAPVQRDDLTVDELAPGVWHLTGGFRLSSLVVEFADHLAIIEVPNNEQRAQALFAKARALRPGKPLTTAIVTHFHADHAGGLRAVVAEGLTIVAQAGNADFFREVARRPKTLAPDALARNPRPIRLVTVDDSLVLKDARTEIDLFHARASSHGDTLLMAYLPGSGILAQGDLWTPGSAITPHAVAFAEDIDARGLKVSRHVAIDSGQVKPDAEFRAYVGRLRAGEVK